jgi:hypothetical protein
VGEVNIFDILREIIFFTDFLAKVGSSNDTELKIWNSPPEDLNSLLRDDALRLLRPKH